jgi:hypothetical protein
MIDDCCSTFKTHFFSNYQSSSGTQYDKCTIGGYVVTATLVGVFCVVTFLPALVGDASVDDVAFIGEIFDEATLFDAMSPAEPAGEDELLQCTLQMFFGILS